jgi:AraC-like DNA-binding protein
MDASNHMFFKPSFLLRDVIDHYWFAEVYKSVDGSVSSHRQIHLPESCIDLFMDYHNSYHKTSICNKDLGNIQSTIIGTRDVDNIIQCSCFSVPFKGIRIRFTIPGFYKLFRIPVCNIYNNVFSSNEVLGNDLKILQDKIEHARNNYIRKDILDQFFLTQMNRNSDKNTNTKRCLEALDIIDTHNGNIKLTYLIKQVNMSERSLEYHFKTITGITPKDYCIILRIKNVLNRLSNPQPFKWHDLIADNGYYDQAHLINEFKKATTITPEYFLKNVFRHLIFANNILVFTKTDETKNDMGEIFKTYSKSRDSFLNRND